MTKKLKIGSLLRSKKYLVLYRVEEVGNFGVEAGRTMLVLEFLGKNNWGNGEWTVLVGEERGVFEDWSLRDRAEVL